jgi:5'-methylthioadenosine phosphorylase
MIRVGIIGGSGLNDPDFIEDAKEFTVETDYGLPSAPLVSGRISGVDVVMLPRHGRGHHLCPSQINNRANIQALKRAGVTHIIATSACGSLRQHINRGDFVILDQFIDFTRFRKISFTESFECGIVHASMAFPFDANLSRMLFESSRSLGFDAHANGCVVTIEGPRFSTVAESRMFQAWGADVINMTTAPEAMLANEAQIPYSVVALSTDYDSWKVDEPPVTWDEIMDVFHRNIERVKTLLSHTLSRFGV